MSVAFRRESDEEHLEPKFELPIPPGPNMVTRRGYDLLADRTAELEAELAGTEDEKQRKRIQRDLRYWRTRLATAQIAPDPSGDTVAIGTRVTFERGGQSRTITVVGHDEADPAKGLVAYSSPMGHALLGAQPGEEITAPGGDSPITVKAIEIA